MIGTIVNNLIVFLPDFVQTPTTMKAFRGSGR